jgi:YfiH family protein
LKKPVSKAAGPAKRPYRNFRVRAGKTVIRYGFSTRQAGYPDFYAVLEKEAPVTVPDQTHSANIHDPAPSSRSSKKAARAAAAEPKRVCVPDCDALVTARAGQTLTVRTADCLPIFIWEKTGKAVAVVHAGWKGTHQRIATKAVARLTRLGAKPQDLRVVFGPAIRSCCYEVGPEFLERFPAPTLKPNAAGRHQFDLVLANRLQLEAAGVPKTSFKDLGLCTACDTQTFFSFRKDPSNTGRMIHWIRRD